MRMKDPRLPLNEAAKSLGYSPTTLYMWTKRPEYIRYENWLVSKQWDGVPPAERAERQASQARIKERFEEHAEEMQDRLLAILDTVDDPKIQTQVAMDWLDRAGHSVQRESGAGVYSCQRCWGQKGTGCWIGRDDDTA